MWEFWWYADPNNPHDPWRTWYERQDGQVRGRHDIVFRFLDCRQSWTEPYSKKLGDGLVEIIIKAKVQHRLLGFDWPRRLSFTILLTCTHKGKIYAPKNAIETARTRIKELRNGGTWIKSCVRPE